MRRFALLTALVLSSALGAYAGPFYFFFLENSQGGTITQTVRADIGIYPPPIAHCGNLGGPGVAVHPNAATNTFYLHSGGALKKLVADGGGCRQDASAPTQSGVSFAPRGMAISQNGAVVWITDDGGLVAMHDANSLAQIAYVYIIDGASGPLCKIRSIDVNPANGYEAAVTSSNCNTKKIWYTGSTWMGDAGVADTDDSFGVTWAPDGSRIYSVRLKDGTDRLVEIDPWQVKRIRAFDLLERSRDVIVRYGYAFAPAVGSGNNPKMVIVRLGPGGPCDPVVTTTTLTSVGNVTGRLDGLSRYGDYLYVLAGEPGVMAQFSTITRQWTGWKVGVGLQPTANGPFTPLY
jgi:hypothetical protein